MGLVDYRSDSSEDEADSRECSAKRLHYTRNKRPEKAEAGQQQALPPLPNSFHDLYAVAPRLTTGDDPALHHGRKRTTPHVEGKWPTHVYLEWLPSSKDLDSLSQIVTQIRGRANSELYSLLVSELGSPRPLHISLSPPLALRTEERDGYVTSLANSIRQFLSRDKERTTNATGDISKRQVRLRLNGLKWAANAEGNRWFLAVGIVKPDNDELNKLLAACNAVAVSQSLPTLYMKPPSTAKNPLGSPNYPRSGESKLQQASSEDSYQDQSDRFHFSIAWTLEQPTPANATTPITNLSQQDSESISNLIISIGVVKVKVGNSIKNIPLA